MTLRVLILSFVASAFALAGELPWIGVAFDRPEHEEREDAGLAEGVGLKVDRVVSESPLGKAGGVAGDLWWKFDGQILVNKRQMLVLLRAKSPGDVVKIDFYRASELKSLSLKLAEKEVSETYTVGTWNGRRGSSRVMSKREQVARVSVDEKELTLKREGEAWRFEVHEGRTSVLSSLVNEGDLSEKVPPKWQGAFMILRLTLEQQEAKPAESDQRRIRYVPRKKSPESAPEE